MGIEASELAWQNTLPFNLSRCFSSRYAQGLYRSKTIASFNLVSEYTSIELALLEVNMFYIVVLNLITITCKL